MTNNHVDKIDKAFFESLLADYWTVKIFLCHHPDVKVPDLIKPAGWGPEGAIPICLEYGLDMPNPITDMRITDEGISATLSFNWVPFETYVPWESVNLITLGDPRPKVRPKPKLGLVP